MDFDDLIRRYLLSAKVKEAKDQSSAFTCEHVVHQVKIKSPILSGKLKTEFTFNPSHTDFELQDLLICLQLDIMSVHPDYSLGLHDFLDNYYPDDTRKGLEVYEACVKSTNKAIEFFGPCGIEDLLSCEE